MIELLHTRFIHHPKGRIARQLYFGQDMGHKKRDVCIRRSKLQEYAGKGDRTAIQKLRKLKKYETNYTETRCWQVAHKIISLAKEYNAFISIEDLHGLKDAKGHRKSNRKTKRMPYHMLRVALESVAGQNNTLVETVDPEYTSQICSRCGELGTRDGATFRCSTCGNEVNADRNASVNIAIRAGIHTDIWHFNAQISDGNLPVNAGVCVHDRIGLWCLQHPYHSSTHASPFRAG